MGLEQKKYLEHHKRFWRLAHRPGRFSGKLISFDGYQFPTNEYPGSEMATVNEARASIDEILNWTNQFCLKLHDLACWATILDEIPDEQEKFDVLVEIVTPLPFYVLSLPTAIKDKITFGLNRMFRDTFDLTTEKGKPWSDRDLLLKYVERARTSAKLLSIESDYDALIKKLEEIDGTDFVEKTQNYRNSANHRISPNIEIGERMAFGRWNDGKTKGYTFGLQRALKLSDVIEPLKEEHRRCREAVELFWPICLCLHKHWTEPLGK